MMANPLSHTAMKKQDNGGKDWYFRFDDWCNAFNPTWRLITAADHLLALITEYPGEFDQYYYADELAPCVASASAIITLTI